MEKRTFVTELKYRVPSGFILLFGFFTLNSFLDTFKNFQSPSDVFFCALMGFGLFLTLVIFFTRFIVKRFIKIYEEGLELRINPLRPWKIIFLPFKDITFFRAITDTGRFIDLEIKGRRIQINLNFMSNEGWYFLTRTLESKLTHFSKPIPTMSLHRLKREEEDFPSIWKWVIIFSGIGMIALMSFFEEYDQLQIEYRLFSLPLFVCCACFALWLRNIFFKKYPLHMRRNQRKAQFIAALMGFSLFMGAVQVFTFANQTMDQSRSTIRIVNLKKASESQEYERERGPCYHLIDEKSDSEMKICSVEFRKANESSKALIGYKKGFFGQRWIASIKIID